MKKTLSFILCLLLLCGVALLPSCATRHDDDLPQNWVPARQLRDNAIIRNDERGIPDWALYHSVLAHVNSVRRRAGEPRTDTLTAGDAARVTRLVIAVRYEGDEEYRIVTPRNLRGIEHLRNLEVFRLSLRAEFGHPNGLDSIDELRRLEWLPNLQTFVLGAREEDGLFNDLRFISNLTGLTRLEIGLATNLDGIQNLTNLERLRISGGELTNLDELRYLVNLRHLNANDNQLTDISAVAYLPNLQTLSVIGNQLETLPDLTATNLLYRVELGYQPDISRPEYILNTRFRHNRLSREELERNLPASLLEANDGRWLENNLMFQY